MIFLYPLSHSLFLPLYPHSGFGKKFCLLQKPEVMRVKSWENPAHLSNERCDSLLLAQISVWREVLRIPELAYDILPTQEMDLD